MHTMRHRIRTLAVCAGVCVLLGLTAPADAHGPAPSPTAASPAAANSASVPPPPANSATLAGNKVSVQWEVSDNNVKFTVNTTDSSNYAAIAIGNRMPGSFAYVAWFDGDGEGRVDSYFMGSRSASSIQKVEEALVDWSVTKIDGRISFSFERRLAAGPGDIPGVDPNVPLPLIWALGSPWSGTELQEFMHHQSRSNSGTLVDLSTGLTTISGADEAWKAHGWLMFMAWGVLVPAGVISARYLKGLKNGLWFKLHQAFNALALVFMIIGLAIAINKTEDDGLDHFNNSHTKTGILAVALAVLQPINGLLRPAKPEGPDEAASAPRRAWEVSHRVVGVTAEVLALVTLFSGLDQIVKKGLSEDDEDSLEIALYVWIAVVVFAVFLRELWGRTMDSKTAAKDTELGEIRS